VQSEQSRYGYVIGTRGTRTGVSLSTYGGTKCHPLDHVEGTGLGDTLVPASLYEDQLNRRLHRLQIQLPANSLLVFPTNCLRLQPTILLGSDVATTNEFTAGWRVVSAPGPVHFSTTNAPDPLVTFADRGTNELEVTVTANAQQVSARVAVFLAPDVATAMVSLPPGADTYVRDGTFGNDNYGGDVTLQLKKNTVTNFNRRAFLRFNLSSASFTNFDRAFLELRSPAPPAPGTAPTLQLHFVTNDVWQEAATTWNTQPALGQTLASWPMSTTGLDRMEVTSLTRTEAAGDGLLSLGLLIANPFSDTVYSFHSREASPAVGPQLVLESTNAALSYASWIAGYTNLPPSALAPGNNLDGDRLNNAEEYLFACDPTQADDAGALSITPVVGGVLLAFPLRKHLPATTYFVIENAASLPATSWLPVPGVTFSNGADLGAARAMTAFVPLNSGAQCFFRLRIVLGP
jgi:hypothetical protein